MRFAVLVAIALAGCKSASKSTPLAEPQPPVTLQDGMTYQVLALGSGDEARKGDKVEVHYVGTLQNGTKFDSSRDRDQPFAFRLGTGQVIEGWDLGVTGMKEGEKRRLVVPPKLGYGSSGAGDKIPPNATLIFEVELIDVR